MADVFVSYSRNDRARVARTARTTLARVEKMLLWDPNNATAMGYGALALGALGELERGKEWINRALLIDPDNMNARYNPRFKSMVAAAEARLAVAAGAGSSARS